MEKLQEKNQNVRMCSLTPFLEISQNDGRQNDGMIEEV
jgi:hypothetical protein